MGQRNIAIRVTRESETPGQPSMHTTLTMGTALVFKKLMLVGKAGITTRDFPGWDVRHYLRQMRNVGIGFHDKREPNEFGGSHKRWWLRDGHSYVEIPYPKRTKPAEASTDLVSNSNSKADRLNEALNN